MLKAIKHRWYFEPAPETVWEFLTKSEWISQWLMENDFQPVVGQKFIFKTKPIPDFPMQPCFSAYLETIKWLNLTQ